MAVKPAAAPPVGVTPPEETTEMPKIIGCRIQSGGSKKKGITINLVCDLEGYSNKAIFVNGILSSWTGNDVNDSVRLQQMTGFKISDFPGAKDYSDMINKAQAASKSWMAKVKF